MSVSQVACPQCRTVLKLGQPLPVGYKVKCPVCGAAFGIGPAAGKPTASSPPGPPPPVMNPYPQGVRQPGATRPDGPRGRTQAEFPPGRPASSGFGPPSQPKSNALMLTLVIGGALLFIGAGVGLAIFAFSGSKDKETAEKDKDSIKDKDSTRDKDRDKTKDKDQDKKDKQEVVVRKPFEHPPLAADEQAKVDKAIKDGVAFLQRSQNADGTWTAPADGRIGTAFSVGFNALAGLTLLECGVSEKDPRILGTADFLRSQFPKVFVSSDPANPVWANWDKTYDLTLTILFLDRLKQARDKDLIQKLALRLVAGQRASGGWYYYSPRLTDEDHTKLMSVLNANNKIDGGGGSIKLDLVDAEKLRTTANEPLPEPLKRLPVWGSEPVDEDQRMTIVADNSNTQFAILALWAARKHDVPLNRTLALIVKRFRKTQNMTDGNWVYSVHWKVAPHVNQPTMTCAGLLGLAIGLGLESEGQGAKKSADQDPGVKKALDHLAQAIGQPATPWRATVPMTDMYFIWSVERVGVIYNLHKIGGKDWYRWGAEILVANQRQDGSWQHNDYTNVDNRPHFSAVVDTCFGLLFLKKANLAKGLEKLTLTN